MGSIEDHNKEIVARYWDTLYAHDWNGIASFFTPEANYVDTGIGEAGGGAHGPEQIVARLRLGFERVTHRHELGRLIAEGDAVVTEHAEEWTFETGEVIMHPFTSVMELDGDKISRWWDYSNIGNLVDNAPAWWIEHIASGWRELD